MTISTHILDTARGRPAAGVPVRLDRLDGDSWTRIGGGTTNDDGRVKELAGTELAEGTYRMHFDVADYLDGQGFYPHADIVFIVRDAAQHYHVPLLLSPYGYSTYRGS